MCARLNKRKRHIKNLAFGLMLSAIFLAGCNGVPLPEDKPGEARQTDKPISVPENNPGYPLPLFTFIDGGQESKKTPCADFAEGFETDFPVSVSVLYQNVGGGEPYAVADEATIRAVYEALQNIEVTGENGWAHTDDYLTYSFKMNNGNSISFHFQSGSYHGRSDRLFSLSGFGALLEALDYPSDWEPPEEGRPPYANERLVEV